MITEQRKARRKARLSASKKRKILELLYAKIPKMECFPSCTACCGHTAWSRFEWFRLKPETRADFNFFRLGCDFVKNGKCSIHNMRPFMCRIFGAVESGDLIAGHPKSAIGNCPRGVCPNKKLTVEQAKKLTNIYYKVFFELED